MTFKTKFLIALITSVLISISIISTFVINSIRNHALDSFHDNSQVEINYIDTALSLYLSGISEDTNYLAQSSIIKNLDISVTTYMGKPSGMMTPYLNSEVEQAAYQMMKEFGESHPDLAYVYLGMSHGGYIQWPVDNNSKNYDPRIRPWYTASVNSTKPIFSQVYSDVYANLTSKNYSIKFKGNDGTFGVIGTTFNLTQINNLINSVKYAQNGYMLIVDDSQNIIIDSSKPKKLAHIDKEYENILNNDLGLSSLKLYGETWFMNKSESSFLNWQFIALVPANEVFQRANGLTKYIILFTTIITTFLIIIGIVTIPSNLVRENKLR